MKIIFSLLLSIYMPCLISAQETPIFDLIDLNKSEVNDYVIKFIETFGQADKSKGIEQSWPVRFQNITGKKELEMAIKIPGIDKSLLIKSTHFFEQKTNHKEEVLTYEIWSGEILGLKEPGDFMISRSTAGLTSGFISLNGEYFKIRPIDFKDALLIKRDYSELPSTRCGNELEPLSTERVLSNNCPNPITVPFCDPPPIGSMGCSQPWKILNCYTDILYDQIFSVYDAIYGGNPFLNSLPPQLTIHDLTRGLRQTGQLFVGSLLDYNISTTTMEVPAANVSVPQGNMSFIHWIVADANQFESYAKNNLNLGPNQIYDKAILQTHRTYDGIYGYAAGNPVSCWGYNSQLGETAIVNYTQGIDYPKYAYPHEFGHLFGADHDNQITQICNRGYIFRNNYNGPDRTIMAFLSDADAGLGKGPILRLSSPDLTYNGFVLGNSVRNNRWVIQNVICGNISSSASRPVIRKSNLDFNIDGQLVVFPNPTYKNITLNLEKDTKQIQILNTQGKLLRTFYPKNEQLTIDLSSFASGTYFIRSTSAKDLNIYKVIKND